MSTTQQVTGNGYERGFYGERKKRGGEKEARRDEGGRGGRRRRSRRERGGRRIGRGVVERFTIRNL